MSKKYSQIDNINIESKERNEFEDDNFTFEDPINLDLFHLFLENAGNFSKQKKDLRRLQLQIAYTILYFFQLQIHQIRYLTEKDLEIAVNKGQLHLLDPKTKQKHIYLLSIKIVNQLKIFTPQWKIIFERYKYKYLFGKEKPITDKNLIKVVNQDLRNICINNNIRIKITSDHFRYSGSKDLPTIIYFYEDNSDNNIVNLISQST